MAVPPSLPTTHAAAQTILAADVNDIATAVNASLIYANNAHGIVFVPSTATVAQINSWASALSTAGGGMLFFETATYTFATAISIYSNVIYEFNGSKIVANGTTSDDIVTSLNFAANTGTAALVTGGAVPYRFALRNGVLFQPAGVGRNCLSIYGYAYNLENMTLYSQSVGCALWTEYGSTTESFVSGSTVYGDARQFVSGLFIFDNPSTAAVNTAPSQNNYTVSVTTVTNTTNPTITTNRAHFLTAGQTGVVIASVGGATGVNGTWTVLAIPTPTTFTITLGSAPGVYTSGGTVAYPVSAAWVNLGPHDSVANGVIMAASAHVAARRGILLGKGTTATATGCGFTNTHIYNNFDVAMDMADGNILVDDSCQLEGSYKCVVMMRNGGQMTLHGDVYGGQGGVTLLHIANAVNESDIRAKLFSAGSGAAPPSGFANTYIENWSGNGSIIDMQISHPYSTTLTLGTGQAPTSSRVFINVDNWGGGTATAGWVGGQVDSTHWLYTNPGNQQSTSAVATATSGTIATVLPVSRVAPAGAITGVILQSGTEGGDTVTVINESAFSITFAASGTSKVADGVSDIIAALTAASYVWSAGTSLWYRV